MPRNETSPPGDGTRPVKIHRAARLDDAFLAWRARRARRRGWVPAVLPYTGYGSTSWVRVLGRVLFTNPDRETTTTRRSRGWRSFTSIPAESAPAVVEIAGVRHEVTADRGGVIDTVIHASLAPGWQTIRLWAIGSAAHPVTARVYIVSPSARIGVISDVDDTVMVTALPRPFVAAWNTFVLDEHARMPVPGMAVFLDTLSRTQGGCPVIYLSTGAWNVAPTLTRFLERHLYPAGALLLTDWGPTHDRIFRSGREHKAENLRRLAEEFPDISWVLVGDDGQHDEELYGDFARAVPESVTAVAIRQLSPGQAVLAGGRSKPDEHRASPLWVYAPDGAGLLEQLRPLLDEVAGDSGDRS